MFQAIGRLSFENSYLIRTSCEIMNRVFTKGEYLQKMTEKFEEEKKSDEALFNEGILEKTDMQCNFENSTNSINMNFTKMFFFFNALTVFPPPIN